MNLLKTNLNQSISNLLGNLMVMPKISIVTVSYNQGEYLEKTILSVIEQKYPNLEYIIIDGGSTDDSVDIIKKYESHLTYWVSEKDNGQSEAINKGLAYCTGEIFNWLCSDDYLEPESLFKIGEAFKDKNTHVLFGNVRQFGGIWKDSEILKGTQLQDSLAKTIVLSFITQPVTFWRTSIFKEIGLENKLHWYMDYELWIRYLIKYGQSHVKYIDSLFAHYLFHDNSKSSIECDYTQTKKDSRFKIDMNSIYYSIAKQSNNTHLLPAIKSLSSELLSDYHFNADLTNKADLMLEVINNYIYFNAERYYWINDYPYSLMLLKNVSPNLLQTQERDNYYLYLRRCKMHPYSKWLKRVPLLIKLKRLIFNTREIKK